MHPENGANQQLRNDALAMATGLVHTGINAGHERPDDDKIIETAQKFYKFLKDG